MWVMGMRETATAGAADHLVVSVVPSVRSGEPFSVTVAAQDENGNVDAAFTGPVTLINLQAAVVANGQTAFDAAVTPTFVDGVATFTGLRISNAADGYSFTAAASGVTSGTSNFFNVTFNSLAFGPVADVVSGVAFDATVTATDNNGATAENFAGI